MFLKHSLVVDGKEAIIKVPIKSSMLIGASILCLDARRGILPVKKLLNEYPDIFLETFET